MPKQPFEVIDLTQLDTVTGGAWTDTVKGAWNGVKAGAQKGWEVAKDWASKQLPPGVIKN